MTTKERQSFYEIHVKGQLAPSWVDWFYGFAFRYSGPDETILSGPVADQAALHGLLTRIRDLNLTLLSLAQIESAQAKGETYENSS